MPNSLFKSLLVICNIFNLSPFAAAAADSLNPGFQPGFASVGAHERRVQYATRLSDEAGTELIETNSYVQLQTGLNRWDETLKTYVPASAAIELVNGHPVIRNAQYQAVFSRNANSPDGLIDLYMPGGERLITQPVGLAVTEMDTGRSVFLGELQDSEAILLDENTVVYPDAFDLFKASIVIRSRLNGIESDVLLQERLDERLLEDLGINPATARLEVWHQVLGKPDARTDFKPLARMNGRQETDVTIQFQQMAIDSGTAFLMEENGMPQEEQIPVGKEWVTLEGIDFLIESVPFFEAKPLLHRLPEPQEARVIDKDRLEQAFAANRTSTEPAIPTKAITGKKAESPIRSKKPLSVAAYAKRGIESKSTPVRPEKGKLFAQAAVKNGFLIDFPVTLTTQTNFTFKGDTTYWVTGVVDLYGTTILEGGAVIKYTNYTSFSPVITVRGPFECRTSPYNVAFFTAEDDDTVGEKIFSSTGTPLTSTFYSWSNLHFISTATNTLEVHDIHSRYSQVGLRIEVPVAASIWNISVYNCDRGIESSQSDLILRNALINKTRFALRMASGWAKAIRAEHLTVNSAQQLFYDSLGIHSLFITNSLLCTITNSPTAGITSNTTYTVSASAFTPVGRGNHYLADSTYRNIGNQNISSEAKGILQKSTTYPPVVISGNLGAETILSAVVQRDTDRPDLGYHYSPLDYCVEGVPVSNTLILTNGVALGIYGGKGLILNSGSKFISEGTPMRMNRLVRYNTVQEDPSSRWRAAPSGGLLELGDSGREIRLRFNEICLPSGTTAARTFLSQFEGQFKAVTPLAINDSQLRGLSQSLYTYQSGSTLSFTNSIFARCSLSFVQGYSTYASFPLSIYNNHFYKGTLSLAYYYPSTSWTVKDNLFDCDTVGAGPYAVTASNNGYRAGLTSIGGTGDVTGITANYVSGPLGSFYYPASGGNLSLLINAGSRNATNAGLYHFTTLSATGTKETNSTVDIGFHYAGVDASQLPADGDEDSMPDYLEDRNGNGVFGAGETDWQAYNSQSGLPAVPAIQISNPLK